MPAPELLFTARDTACGRGGAMPAAETLDAVFIRPSSPMSWPPKIEQVEVVSAEPYTHWRSEGVWLAVPSRTVRRVSVEEIFGPRGTDIGHYLNALASDPRGAIERLAVMQGELMPLLGIAWQYGVEGSRPGMVHWAEESIFRDLRAGESAFDFARTQISALGIDPYLLRVVPSSLAVFDQLTDEQQTLIERALDAVLGR